MSAENVLSDDRVREAEQIRKNEKKRGRRLGPVIAKAALRTTDITLKTTGMLLATAAAFGVYEVGTDINANKARLAHTHPYLIENAPLPFGYGDVLPQTERAHVSREQRLGGMAVINFSGLGRTQIPDGGEVDRPFDRIAENLSMVYDMNGIDTDVLARVTDERLRADGVTRLVIWGNSVGGPIGTNVARKVIERDPEIRIERIIFDSSPANYSAVLPESRQEGQMMLEGLKMIPNVQYSSDARIFGEMRMQSDKIHDIPSAIALYNAISHEVRDNPALPSNGLFGDQFTEVVNSHLEEDLTEIAKLQSEDPPTVDYIRAEDPKRDDVVDVVKSYKLLEKFTADRLTLSSPFLVPNAFHGEPEWSMPAYHKIFRQIADEITAADDARTDSAKAD